MGWYAHRRGFEQPNRIAHFMAGLLVTACVLLSLFLMVKRSAVTPAPPLTGAAGSPVYAAAEDILLAHGAAPQDTVMVNNPPGYWLASGRPAVTVPYGDEQMLLAAARQYRVRYLVLELAGPWQLQNLYTGKAVSPELEYIASVGSTRLYQVHPGGQ
jgi:hypothetical protein